MPISLATDPLRWRRSGVYHAQDKQSNMVSLELNHPSYIHMAYFSVIDMEAERKIWHLGPRGRHELWSWALLQVRRIVQRVEDAIGEARDRKQKLKSN